MYKVVSYFTDLKDKNRPYKVGDIYPRDGLEVSEERLAYLASSKTKRGFPVIQKVQEKKKVTRKKKEV